MPEIPKGTLKVTNNNLETDFKKALKLSSSSPVTHMHTHSHTHTHTHTHMYT